MDAHRSTIELAESLTEARLEKTLERTTRLAGAGMTEGALGVTRRCITPLTEAVRERLEDISDLAGHDRQRGFLRLLRNLKPEVIAFSALSVTLDCIASCCSHVETVKRLGDDIRAECWAQGLLQHDEVLSRRVTAVARSEYGSVQRRREEAVKLAKRARYRTREWTQQDLVRAGQWLLNLVLETLPEVFTTIEQADGSHVPTITEGALEIAQQAMELVVQRQPVLPPCTEAPAPWTDMWRGGYWDERSRLRAPFVRTPHKATRAAVRAAMRSGTMKQHVDAVNALQAVPWTINHAVLGVMRWCIAHNVAVPGLPGEDVPEPERLTPEAWADEAQRKLQRITLARVREHNTALVGERLMLQQDLATAVRLAEHERFWTPMSCDWRGRVYATCGFNFQRDDRVRALFLFADGAPIGEEGLWWLKVHVANCGAFDKVDKRPLEERVRWVDENMGMIEEITSNPRWSRKWTEAENPFLFLASCFELTTAMAVGPSFVTRLPISFDGSCSGLQHLCAMTRAPEGALVNLTPGEAPQDVYQTVADAVRIRIAEDSTAGSVLARTCLDYGIDRKLVKRNVMTFAYSSKKYGMTEQHVEDTMKPLALKVLAKDIERHPFASPEDTVLTKDGRSVHRGDGYAAAKYLASHVYDVIESVVHLPAEAMGFLQKLAQVLAHEGKPLQWTTPTGLPWVNRYHAVNVTQVNLWMHDKRVCLRVADGFAPEIAKEKAMNGVAPNFVHACDAAHLLLTVNASVAEGITSIATVHDSFGCLAPYAARFNAIIRETFVRMYQEHDVLQEALDSACCDLTLHNRDRLPDVPARGTLNLEDVKNAKYCFA